MNSSLKNMIAADFEDTLVPVRLKVWEVESCFKCPIIGSCIEMDEQKKMLKKLMPKQKFNSDFEIHEILVASLDDENDLSRKIDELLERKYGNLVSEFAGRTEKEVMDLWKKHSTACNSYGYFFAAATRPSLSFKARKELFGDVHMNMHTSAADLKALRQQVEKLGTRLIATEERLREETAARKKSQKENEALRLQIEKSAKLMEQAGAENVRLSEKAAFLENELRSGQADEEIRSLKEENSRLGKLALESEKLVLDLMTRNRRLSSEIGRQRENSERICSETTRIMEEISEASSCSSACPYYDLCSKRVLIIGGLTRMETLYREMIETNGGVFDYHNGDMRNGSKDLEKSVKRADMIICPIDCNSHGACTMVKKFCKKYGKPFQMLPSSGTSTVFKAVFREGSQSARGIN